VCTLFQDVTLPPGQSQGVLTYSAGYNFRDYGGAGVAAGCDANIAITTTGNVPIATGYDQAANATDAPLNARPALIFTTTPGATVRVLITETSCPAGPVGLVLDNLVLTAGAGASTAVPTLDYWAKLALALLVAGSALYYLRKRTTR
jgi:hypothetical protein